MAKFAGFRALKVLKLESFRSKNLDSLETDKDTGVMKMKIIRAPKINSENLRGFSGCGISGGTTRNILGIGKIFGKLPAFHEQLTHYTWTNIFGKHRNLVFKDHLLKTCLK